MAPQMSLGRSKFPQLKYLTLPEINMLVSGPFPSIFPSITHLHLPHMDGVLHLANLETTLPGQWSSLHTLVFTFLRRDASWMKIGDLMASCLQRCLSHGRSINNLLVDRDILHVMERKVRAGIPVETKIQLVSRENYVEPWWNQEDRLNTLG